MRKKQISPSLETAKLTFCKTSVILKHRDFRNSRSGPARVAAKLAVKSLFVVTSPFWVPDTFDLVKREIKTIDAKALSHFAFLGAKKSH